MEFRQITTEPHNVNNNAHPLSLPELSAKQELICEWYGGDRYEYYPLGDYVVMAPAVCGGRPTFKYTRIEANGALNLMAAGSDYGSSTRRAQNGPKSCWLMRIVKKRYRLTMA